MNALKTIFLKLPLALFELIIVISGLPFGYLYGMFAGGFRKGCVASEARCLAAHKLYTPNTKE
jgi:hypothetical protein